MDNEKIELANKLINDLYLDLRRKVNYWSDITKQTPQAKMGYIGQHLVSIVTGFSGGKSGARGYDLIISNTEYGEIKTCYRVDQLGKCNNCNNVVSAVETKCSVCESENIKRNDDSKWLLTIKKYDDLEKMIEPLNYYFVLFEFDKVNINDIVIDIWEVDSKCNGFALCMLDYYFNIRENSSSKAPFNMWPHQFKFALTRPVKIYESIIKEDNSIDTKLFMPENPKADRVKFHDFVNATTINIDSLIDVMTKFGIEYTVLEKNDLLNKIDKWLVEHDDEYENFVDEFANSIYIPLIKKFKDNIPDNYFNIIKKEDLN